MPAPLRPNALVIEVNPLQRARTRQLLEQLGVQVEETDEGLQGLALVEAMAPDIVRPDVDGYSICRVIRKLVQGQSVPVLVLLEREDSNVIDGVYGAGATDWLCKPLCATVFRHRVGYFLDSRRCLRALAARAALLTRAQSIAAVGSWC